MSRTAAHWPDGVRYLRTLAYSADIAHEMKEFIQGSPQSGSSTVLVDPAQHPSVVVIRKISDAWHPANGQRGLFAKAKINRNTFILDYFGEVHVDDRGDSDYDLSLCRKQFSEGVNFSVGIDAAQMGNEARFINDYRGIKGRPNALFKERRTREGELRMSIWSGSETIKKGEEILVSYGKSWWGARHVEGHEDGP